MGKSIYRFYGNRDFDLDSLANSYLWFSDVKDFNDPFEGLYLEQLDMGNVGGSPFLHPFKEAWLALFKRGNPGNESLIVETSVGDDVFISELQAVVESTVDDYKRFKHCSFSQDDESAEKLALENKLLWSHYSDGLRGFSIEFDLALLMASISGEAGVEKTTAEMLYDELGKVDVVERVVNDMNRSLMGKGGDGVGAILTTKCAEWQYENEFRLLHWNQVVEFDKSSIKSITLGYKMSKARRNTLLAIIGSIGFNPSEMVKFACIDEDSFRVKIKSFDEFNKSDK